MNEAAGNWTVVARQLKRLAELTGITEERLAPRCPRKLQKETRKAQKPLVAEAEAQMGGAARRS